MDEKDKLDFRKVADDLTNIIGDTIDLLVVEEDLETFHVLVKFVKNFNSLVFSGGVRGKALSSKLQSLIEAMDVVELKSIEATDDEEEDVD